MASFILLSKEEFDIGVSASISPEYGYISRTKEEITTIV